MGKKELRAALLEVVENQISSGDPPETRQTLERLVNSGYSRKIAVLMIASVLVKELWDMQKEQRVFDRARFIADLESLPQSWEAMGELPGAD